MLKVHYQQSVQLQITQFVCKKASDCKAIAPPVPSLRSASVHRCADILEGKKLQTCQRNVWQHNSGILCK